MRLPAASTPWSIVCSVLRFRLRDRSVRSANMSLVKSISVPVSPLAAVDLVKESSILFSLASRTILSVFLFVIALLKPHSTKLQKWTHIYPQRP